MYFPIFKMLHDSFFFYSMLYLRVSIILRIYSNLLACPNLNVPEFFIRSYRIAFPTVYHRVILISSNTNVYIRERIIFSIEFL